MAANGGGTKKKEQPNMVHWNEMFADRIRHEQQAAKEWQGNFYDYLYISINV